jgi:hypothetical protein
VVHNFGHVGIKAAAGLKRLPSAFLDATAVREDMPHLFVMGSLMLSAYD